MLTLKYKGAELTIKADIYEDATSARDDIQEFIEAETAIDYSGVDGFGTGELKGYGVPSFISDLMEYAIEMREEKEVSARHVKPE